jgi:RNA polymerase sigma-70 factor (ECF subfamily)
MHDEALMIQWNRRGDSDAFRTIIQRYGNMVFATALRVLGNPADAEDVAQDCFEKLARTHKTPRGYLGPWLHRMAVNRALDRVRSDSARKRRETVYENNKPSATELEWDDIYPLVDEAIDRLPEKLRRALVAHYLEGLTHDQIAQRESVTRAAITQRIQRALEQMRTSLQRKGVAVSGVSILAGTLGSHLAEAAVLPVSLAEKLGRIALSGPAVGTTGAAVGLAALSKVAVGVFAALAIVAGGIVLFSPQKTVSGPPATVQIDARTAELSPEEPLQSTEPSTNDPKALVEAVTAALATPVGGQTTSVSGHISDKATQEDVAGAEILCRVNGERFTAESDERGMYAFDALPAGELHILCRSANGYYMAHERYEGAFSPFRRTINLAAGQRHNGVDFALERGLSFTGRVVDENGAPIVGATVTAHADPDNTRILNTSVSDLEGCFVVSGFPKTVELALWATKDELVSELYGPFALPQSESARPDVVLWPEAIIRGMLVDRAGKPVEGLRVVPQFLEDVAAREVNCVSDSEGHFELKGMPPGIVYMRVCRDVEVVNLPCPSYTLTAGEILNDVVLECRVGNQYIAGVVVDERGNPMSAEVRCGAPDGSNCNTRANGAGMFMLEGLEPGSYKVTAFDWGRHIPGEPVEAKTGDTTVRLVMHDPIPVSGRVIDAESSSPVTDYEIKDCFSPFLITHDQRYQRNQSLDGTFQLSVMQTGDVRIAARAHGYSLGYADVNLKLGGGPKTDVEIRLQPQANLHGTVRNADGQPVSGALLFSGKVQRSDAEDFASARTGEDGSFVLPAGKLIGDILTVYHLDYPETAFTLEQAHWAGQPIDIRLADSSSIECTFLLDGVPTNSASVWAALDPPDRTKPEGSEVTRQDGTCTMRGLAAGEYRLGASPPGQSPPLMATLETRVVLHEGESLSVLLPFQTGTAALTGNVTGNADWLNLRLEMPLPGGLQRYVMLPDGASDVIDPYLFPDLPAGPATLLISWGVEGQGGHQVKQELVLQPGAVVAHDVDLDALEPEHIPGSPTR